MATLATAALVTIPAGAALCFAAFWTVQSIGPVERTEAVTVTRSSTGDSHHLVFRTAEGERFEAWSADEGFDMPPGEPVRLEISEVGHQVRAVERLGERVAVGSGLALVFWAVLFGGWIQAAVLVGTAEQRRLGLGLAGSAAGLAAGAVPVFLLF
ncbi:hypothetical protein [Amycolatopsis sp. WQ 127309]|uniref:hypothetical protein n=1 Tax=Amycolatopsis sp. WQ 127309 TaxID=2932773 RepID=UPI001FF2C44D|nr:hypothetical protein [Amycolatopsis sp. WQ 127309]UOZ09737.1 hypothetical protein MUY22_16260 [Amycolatopsis sp. WQ 127309]